MKRIIFIKPYPTSKGRTLLSENLLQTSWLLHGYIRNIRDIMQLCPSMTSCHLPSAVDQVLIAPRCASTAQYSSLPACAVSALPVKAPCIVLCIVRRALCVAHCALRIVRCVLCIASCCALRIVLRIALCVVHRALHCASQGAIGSLCL